MVRYEQKSKKRRSGVQREKRKEKDGMGPKSRAARIKKEMRAASSRAKVTFQVMSRFLAPRPIFFNPWNVHLDPGRTGTRIETNRTATVTKYGNQENPSG